MGMSFLPNCFVIIQHVYTITCSKVLLHTCTAFLGSFLLFNSDPYQVKYNIILPLSRAPVQQFDVSSLSVSIAVTIVVLEIVIPSTLQLECADKVNGRQRCRTTKVCRNVLKS